MKDWLRKTKQFVEGVRDEWRWAVDMKRGTLADVAADEPELRMDPIGHHQNSEAPAPIEERAVIVPERINIDLELDPPINSDLLDWEMGEIRWSEYAEVDDDWRTTDHWKGLPEEMKLDEIMRNTSVAGLPSRQAREFLERKVDFSQIPEERQREIMGDDWARIGPLQATHGRELGESYAQRAIFDPPTHGLSSLRPIRQDAPKIDPPTQGVKW